MYLIPLVCFAICTTFSLPVNPGDDSIPLQESNSGFFGLLLEKLKVLKVEEATNLDDKDQNDSESNTADLTPKPLASAFPAAVWNREGSKGRLLHFVGHKGRETVEADTKVFDGKSGCQKEENHEEDEEEEAIFF